jgi:excisionase family DNA binding protein
VVANGAGFPVRTKHSRPRCTPPVHDTGAAEPARLVTVKELGTYLNVSPAALYRLIRAHQLPAVKVGRQWRIELEKVQDWLIDGYERRSGDLYVVKMFRASYKDFWTN